jgi:hypothetical protein
MTGFFFQDEIKIGRDIYGYDWEVIVDPTRSEDDPGLFYGGLFRMVDLRLDRDEKSTWPDGIVFEHKRSGQRLTFEKGKLFDLTHNKVLGQHQVALCDGCEALQGRIAPRHPDPGLHPCQ